MSALLLDGVHAVADHGLLVERHALGTTRLMNRTTQLPTVHVNAVIAKHLPSHGGFEAHALDVIRHDYRRERQK